MYLNRVAEKTIHQYLSLFPALGVTGPRQSGKSTLLKHLLQDYQYVSFDDPKNIEYFETDPEAFMATYANQVIFDEVQFVPKLFNYIKIAVDNDRKQYGKFVLTGSSQFSYLKNVSESLAGRVGLISLLPLTFQEMPKMLLNESIYQGAYPELVTRDYYGAELWFSAYFDTYLNKDVRTLSQIGNMHDFSRFVSLLATNTSQLLDLSHYAKDLGLSVPTIKRWISVLEASYIIFLLPPYHRNLGKRIIKSPKVYFYDTGLVSYLTGIKRYEHYDQGPMAGALFENYIIAEVKKAHLHKASQVELYYFRTSDKAEIDLILDYKYSIDFVEIKKSASFSMKFISTLKKYKQTSNKAFLVYRGETLSARNDILILNYKEYLENSGFQSA